ncbi:winged helix-turn-helix domain-containing protein [Streptomyces sp. NPDC051183]
MDYQRWTQALAAEPINHLFDFRSTPRGVSYLMHRPGWSPQVPAHRAVKRDGQAVAGWRRKQLVRGKRTAQLLGAWAASRTRPRSRAPWSTRYSR